MQTGRQITMVVQLKSSILYAGYVRMQAGTVAEFSVVHATVGLAQARPNYVGQQKDLHATNGVHTLLGA